MPDIDFSKPITLGASGAAPTKTSMNLLPPDTTKVNMGRFILWALIIIALVALFAKFFVLDRYALIATKQSELATQQATLTAVQAQLANYGEIQTAYRSYGGNIDKGKVVVDAREAADLVAKIVEPRATVTGFGTDGERLTINVKDVTLDTVGAIANSLKAQPLVADAQAVTAANTSDADRNVTAMIEVTLQIESEEEAK